MAFRIIAHPADQEAGAQAIAKPQPMGNMGNQSALNQSLIESLANNPATNFILGLGDPSRQFLTEAANLLPGVDIEHKPSGEGLAYGLGNIVGTALPMAAPLGAAGVGLRALGASGRILPILQGALGTGAYETLINPENRLKAGLIGASLGGGTSAAMPILGKTVEMFTPTARKSLRQSREILQRITGGKTTEEAMDSLSEKLTESLGSIESEVNRRYTDALANAGDKKFFGKIKSIIGKEAYEVIPAKIKGGALKNAENDRTINSLHRLQSDFGKAVRSNKRLLSSDNEQAELLEQARERIQDVIHNTLPPRAAMKYIDAGQFYLSEYRPYFENEAIQKSINRVGQPKGALINAFKYPENNKTISKILEHVGPEIKNDLLTLALGEGAKKSPEKLISRASSMLEGLESYMPEEFLTGIAHLGKTLENVGPIESVITSIGKWMKHKAPIPGGIANEAERPIESITERIVRKHPSVKRGIRGMAEEELSPYNPMSLIKNSLIAALINRSNKPGN